MGTQARLPATLPPLPQLRKNHKIAVATERQAQEMVDNLRSAMAEARKALKKAVEQRRATEDDLDAYDEGRRGG